MSQCTKPAVAEAELGMFMCNFLSPAVPALPGGKPHPPYGNDWDSHVWNREGGGELQFLQRDDGYQHINPLHWHVADSLEFADPCCALFLSGLPSLVCSKCWGGQFSKAEFSAGFLCLVGCIFAFSFSTESLWNITFIPRSEYSLNSC